MTLHVLNDIHLGVQRSGGTTPATALALRQKLLAGTREMLEQINGDLLVNGDLFDGADIPRADMLEAVRMFSTWLDRDVGDLFLANGNHDLDKASFRLSSFQFFAQLLCGLYPDRVVHIAEGTYIEQHDVYVLPHLPNQDLANLALEQVPACRALFVHMNYDNQFAVEMDHSLNMSREQAEKLPVEYIIFGHEHQARTELGGKVVIVGNQLSSSISDCLGPAQKYRLELAPTGLKFHQTWTAEGSFEEQDWRDLNDRGDFIRVTGTATPAEAAKVVDVVARFRRTAGALVITNAVKVGEVDDGAEMALTHEEITSFNVMAALREFLGPEDAAEVDAIMKEHQNA